MAMEKLCMRVRAERVWSQERRWRGGEMDDDHVINKKHSALCRHKAGVSTSAQSSAHRVSAPGSAEGFLFCPISCTISSRTSRKGLELVEPLERSQETELWVPDSHSETRPCNVAATGPLTTISTTPLTLAISPVLPLSLHQHYTPHAELPRYRATLRCFLYLSPLTICFFFSFKGAIYPQLQPPAWWKCTTYRSIQVSLPSMCFRGQERRSLLWPSKASTCKTLLGATCRHWPPSPHQSLHNSFN